MFTFIIKHQITSIALALLMLVTSVNFTIDLHYCKGHIHSYNLFGKAKSCHQMSKDVLMEKCCHYKKMILQKGSCSLNEVDNCQNKTVHIQLEIDKNISSINFNIGNSLQKFITAFTLIYFNIDYKIRAELHTLRHYLIPYIFKDIPILIQSFLL